MKKILIVGTGRFAKVLLRLFADDFQLGFLSRNIHKAQSDKFWQQQQFFVDLKQAFLWADIIIYAVPISTIKNFLAQHQKYFNKRHLFIDIASVKTYPRDLYKKYCSNLQVLLTHPMFGPDSSFSGFKGLPIMVDKFTTNEQNYQFWQKYFSQKGLVVKEMKAKEHDLLAANSQGVTHFIGRILDKIDLQPTPIDTLGAKKLQEVKQQTCNDSFQLFKDLQNFNPYTKQMRLRIGKAYDQLYNKLLPKRVNSQFLVFGIQGGKGSFNEQALHVYLNKHHIEKYKVKYLYTSKKVLSALHKGEIDFGQFATHNSIGGMVRESVEAMAQYKFKIVEEFAIKIAHFAMKRSDVKLDQIKKFLTHPQVIKQCSANLKQHASWVVESGSGDLIDHANVAKALATGKIAKEIGVIGPEILAKIYNLDIVERDLQDLQENYTTFLMVKRN